MKPPAKNPCGSCPYRQDVPSGIWHESEYTKLPNYDLPTQEQPLGVFGCHQNNGCACSGWVAVHDMKNNLALRVSFGMGHIDNPDAFLDYSTDVPLFASGQEAADHGMRDILNPDETARKKMRKLLEKGVATTEESA